MAIVESRSGSLWLGTLGDGLNVLDPATGNVRQLPFGTDEPGAVSAPIVTAIAEDAQRLSLDRNGRRRPQSRARRRHRAESLPARREGRELAAGQHDLRADAGRQGPRLGWHDVAGLVRVTGSAGDPKSIRFEAFGRDQGLSSDTIYGVVPDASGAIWLSGNAGLMRFDPTTRAVKTWHREHGLQGEEFAFGAHHRLRDGRVIFGGTDGFNLIDPAKLSENRQPPRLALTNVEVLGVPFPARRRSGCATRSRSTIAAASSRSISACSISLRRSTTASRIAWRVSRSAGSISAPSGASRSPISIRAITYSKCVRPTRIPRWSKEPLRVKIHRDPAPWIADSAALLRADRRARGAARRPPRATGGVRCGAAYRKRRPGRCIRGMRRGKNVVEAGRRGAAGKR